VGFVMLCTPAPPGGVTVTVKSTNPAAVVQPRITIPAGQTSGYFYIRTTAVTEVQTGYVIAKVGSSTQQALLKVRPARVINVSLYPNPVVGPDFTTGSVSLECPAPAGGTIVYLSSSNPTVAAPVMSSITIPAGTSYKNFKVRTRDVPSARTAIIKATANGTSMSTVLTVQ
jgi:hypothetical protein